MTSSVVRAEVRNCSQVGSSNEAILLMTLMVSNAFLLYSFGAVMRYRVVQCASVVHCSCLQGLENEVKKHNYIWSVRHLRRFLGVRQKILQAKHLGLTIICDSGSSSRITVQPHQP